MSWYIWRLFVSIWWYLLVLLVDNYIIHQYFSEIPKLTEPFLQKSTFHQSVMTSSMKLPYLENTCLISIFLHWNLAQRIAILGNSKKSILNIWTNWSVWCVESHILIFLSVHVAQCQPDCKSLTNLPVKSYFFLVLRYIYKCIIVTKYLQSSYCWFLLDNSIILQHQRPR